MFESKNDISMPGTGVSTFLGGMVYGVGGGGVPYRVYVHTSVRDGLLMSYCSGILSIYATYTLRAPLTMNTI
jgi:hypothetical protein